MQLLGVERGQFRERQVEPIVDHALAGGGKAAGRGIAESWIAIAYGERLHVAGDRLDDPEVRLRSRKLDRGPRFLEKLMRRFMENGAGVLLRAGEEVDRARLVEIDA